MIIKSKILKVAILLLLVAVYGAACSDPVATADEADVGAGDISEDTVDDEDIASADAVDDEDTGPKPVHDGWIECDCPNPDDECSPSHCGIPGSDCSDDGEPCPDGYKCQLVGYGNAPACVCDGSLEECAHPCESHADCPTSWHTCDFQSGRCRGANRCISQIQCPDGTYCTQEDDSCAPGGDRADGEACESDGECESAYCYDGLCRQRCRYDGDCEDGFYCGGNSIDEIRCRIADCEISCSETMRCTPSPHGNSCQDQFCYTTGDCISGDCQLREDFLYTRPGECVVPDEPDLENYCKNDEFYWGQGYCSNLSPCWSDEDCDEPYSCNTAEGADEGGSCFRHYEDL